MKICLLRQRSLQLCAWNKNRADEYLISLLGHRLQLCEDTGHRECPVAAMRAGEGGCLPVQHKQSLSHKERQGRIPAGLCEGLRGLCGLNFTRVRTYGLFCRQIPRGSIWPDRFPDE